jgi:hypothetical protein
VNLLLLLRVLANPAALAEHPSVSEGLGVYVDDLLIFLGDSVSYTCSNIFLPTTFFILDSISTFLVTSLSF